MSRNRILIIGGSITAGSFVLACVLWYFAFGVTEPMVAKGATPTTNGWITLALTILGASGLSLTSLLGLIITPVAAYFGIGTDTTKKLIVSVDDAAKIASYMRLYSTSVDRDAKAKIREAAKSETDSLFNTWFPVDEPLP
jgi:hypothetical protein